MNELVKINDNNQVTTDSLTVADRFGKRHRDVLRSIKLLKCSKDFNARNFAPVEYKDQKGEKRTYYDMTQDGWMFLVMGFTGEKAAEWKEKFIVAFRAMEAELRKRQDKLVIVSEHTRALPSGKKEIVLSAKTREEIREEIDHSVNNALERLFNPNPIENRNLFRFCSILQSVLSDSLDDILCTADKKDLENRRLKRALQKANSQLKQINASAQPIVIE
mgnify:FL=1